MCRHAALDHKQHDGNAYAVVSTQRRAARDQSPVPFGVLDGIFFKIVRRVGIFFADHIKVALQKNGRQVLVPLRRPYLDEHIVLFVTVGVAPLRFGKSTDKICNFPLLARRAGDLTYFFEKRDHAIANGLLLHLLFSLHGKNSLTLYTFCPCFASKDEKKKKIL